MQRQNCFIGQVNNIVCFFDKLNRTTKLSLYKANCSSILGCELWLLDSCSTEKFCVVWKKGVETRLGPPPELHIITFYHCYQTVCQSSMRYVKDLQGLLRLVSAVIIIWLSLW